MGGCLDHHDHEIAEFKILVIGEKLSVSNQQPWESVEVDVEAGKCPNFQEGQERRS